MEAFAGLYLFVVLLLIVLAVCWIVLPFAILGTKPLLRDILAEAKLTNAHLARVEGYVRYMAEVTKESTEKKR